MLSTTSLATAFIASAAAAAVPKWDQWAHGRVLVNNITMHYRWAASSPPMVLVHGNPQPSRLLGPMLAQKYTVIAPDNRGMGDSTIPPDGDYSSEAMASDQAWSPQYNWDTYSLYPLAAWAVPDAAERFQSGREREAVLSFFFHASYTGLSGFPLDVIDRVVDDLRKLGGLRAMFGAFDARIMGKDAAFFNVLNKKPLDLPFLALAGEASLASVLKPVWGPIGKNTTLDIVPQAGHFPADENPEWLFQRINQFFDPHFHQLKKVDLSVLRNRVTLI
ncbi:hypothetical protein MKX08_003345 [Trichoderma sp. CBMAI-0020]|nr:hypothetical protein MKX08_003345 [Trichoderma sp. CBMAI-0020]